MKIDRLIAIVMLLLERDKVSAKDMANMFEVSTRTIYRDLESINQAGIPILSTSGPGGGVEILKTYKIERRLFSASDITTLLMGLGSIRSSMPNEEIIGTLAKIEGMIPPDREKEFNFRAGQIKIDTVPWLSSGGISDKIKVIRKSLDMYRVLSFDYKNFKNQNSKRKMEPYRLLAKGEDWYVQGYCLMRKDFRTFKLLRMEQICLTDETFEIRDFPAERMDTPSFNDTRLVPGKIRIHQEVKDRIVSRFGEDCLISDGPYHYIANIHFPVDEAAGCYLLGFGSKCECLEPIEMRALMRQLSADIYHLYTEK